MACRSNQATYCKLFVDNHNYASSLCQEFNSKIINDFLDRNKCVINNLNKSVSSQKMLKLTRIGKLPSQKIKKSIDFSIMPVVSSILKNEEQVHGSLISYKRKIVNQNSDETDSSFDNKSINSKRFRFNDDIKEIEEEVFDKKSLSKYDDMNEKELWNLTNKYSDLSDYKELSIALGLDKNDVSTIESKYLNREGLKECFYQCLLTWRLQRPENCSLEYFVQVLANKLNKTTEFIKQLTSRILLKSKEDKNKETLNFYIKMIGAENRLDVFKLDDNNLWTASKFMAQEWKSIGRGLNLSELDLANINLKYSSEGIRECCYQTLILWNQIYYETSHLEYLCLNLIEMKFNLFAKKMIEQCLI